MMMYDDDGGDVDDGEDGDDDNDDMTVMMVRMMMKKLKEKFSNCGERVQKLSLFGFVNPESKLSWQLLADN